MIRLSNSMHSLFEFLKSYGQVMTPFKSPQLRIKHVSLGLEAALIHRDESRIKQQIKAAKASNDARALARIPQLRADRDSLREHRKTIVRPAARDAALAYGFLRGRSYLQIERKRFTDPNWAAIEQMVIRHGVRAGAATTLKQNFERWKQEAGPVSLRE